MCQFDVFLVFTCDNFVMVFHILLSRCDYIVTFRNVSPFRCVTQVVFSQFNKTKQMLTDKLCLQNKTKENVYRQFMFTKQKVNRKDMFTKQNRNLQTRYVYKTKQMFTKLKFTNTLWLQNKTFTDKLCLQK